MSNNPTKKQVENLERTLDLFLFSYLIFKLVQDDEMMKDIIAAERLQRRGWIVDNKQ